MRRTIRITDIIENRIGIDTIGKENPKTIKSPITNPKIIQKGTLIIGIMDQAVPFPSNIEITKGPTNPKIPPRTIQPARIKIDLIITNIEIPLSDQRIKIKSMPMD
jgi:hypothetical protein